MEIANLFTPGPQSRREETCQTLLATDRFRLERIISTGQGTPAGQWYDQESTEWVALLSGRAGLLFEGEDGVRVMNPGDYVLIPARRRHRVEWTDPDQETIWLAFHYESWGTSMSDILVRRKPETGKLAELGVPTWPIWTKEVSEFPWSYDAQETCYFLEGDVEVTPSGGKTVRIGKGDLVTFPKGMSCTWKVLAPVRKHYRFE